MLYQTRQIRNQILVHWLRNIFPDGKHFLNPRLGRELWQFVPISRFGKSKGKLINCEARADAIVVQGGKVYIIECLNRPESWKVEKLKEYERLF